MRDSCEVEAATDGARPARQRSRFWAAVPFPVSRGYRWRTSLAPPERKVAGSIPAGRTTLENHKLGCPDLPLVTSSVTAEIRASDLADMAFVLGQLVANLLPLRH